MLSLSENYRVERLAGSPRREYGWKTQYWSKVLWLTPTQGQELDLWEGALGGVAHYREPGKSWEKGWRNGK